MKYTSKSRFLIYRVNDDKTVDDPLGPFTFIELADLFDLKWSDSKGLEKIGGITPFNEVKILYDSIIDPTLLFQVDENYTFYDKLGMRQDRHKGKFAILYFDELPGSSYPMDYRDKKLEYHVRSELLINNNDNGTKPTTRRDFFKNRHYNKIELDNTADKDNNSLDW